MQKFLPDSTAFKTLGKDDADMILFWYMVSFLDLVLD
jgi:hypothetical protein